MVGYVVMAVVVLAVLYAIATYNRLVRQRNLVREGWSGIDVQLQRRADLVPNLVETVKGYAAHERGLFEEIAASRPQSMAARPPPSGRRPSGGSRAAIGRLMALAEAYPELKANANFRQLQGQLAEVEDQLQMAPPLLQRHRAGPDTLVQSFPSNLVAGGFGFKRGRFFQIDEASRRAQVSFAR